MDPSDFIKNELIPEMVKKGVLSPLINSIEISPIATDGTFMMTTCRKVKIYVKLPNNQEEVHQLVVKVTPKTDETTYKSMQFFDLFTNEINAYTNVFNTLEWNTTKYYFSFNRPMSACIVLRDFSQDGYRMCEHMFNLPLEYVLIAVRELGTFHGYAYAVKESDPNQFQKIVSLFKESRYNIEESSKVWEMMSIEGPKRAINLVRKSSTMIPEKFLQKLESFYDNPTKFQKKLAQPVEPLAVICHGDYLRNNIAFKYNEDTPIKALMFDFQTLRYASPMVDVTVFLCNSTGCDVRTRYFEEIFNTYHDSVIKGICDKIGKNKNELPEYYSRASFLREYTKMLPFGLGIAGSFLPILHNPMEQSNYELFEMGENVEKAKEMFIEKCGETVDKELKSLVHHIYDLMVKLEMELE